MSRPRSPAIREAPSERWSWKVRSLMPTLLQAAQKFREMLSAYSRTRDRTEPEKARAGSRRRATTRQSFVPDRSVDRFHPPPRLAVRPSRSTSSRRRRSTISPRRQAVSQARSTIAASGLQRLSRQAASRRSCSSPRPFLHLAAFALEEDVQILHLRLQTCGHEAVEVRSASRQGNAQAPNPALREAQACNDD